MLATPMYRWLAITALISCLLTVVACPGFTKRPKLRGEPCTRTAQCDEGLACLAGECLPLDGGVDSGTDGGDGG